MPRHETARKTTFDILTRRHLTRLLLSNANRENPKLNKHACDQSVLNKNNHGSTSRRTRSLKVRFKTERGQAGNLPDSVRRIREPCPRGLSPSVCVPQAYQLHRVVVSPPGSGVGESERSLAPIHRIPSRIAWQLKLVNPV